ncbi:MAG: DNA repair protein RecO (recombination protein O) [Candidatus Berkelbacteria bacterium Licking1014_85]|uniref:DNA repair protein RecO (Recombination protein O) n=1 Tax=Candidatus Berkelbacteria bacterium Licking1014_85 TaxID=2017148 RepID=A0A554LJW6_9BACT|nr:MAG: DNA repair protein RecO (recombination protein O) [Candidatus Berkelbacteria bacterium Licking1014_85]
MNTTRLAEGYIIYRRKIGEADLNVTVFSKQCGKIILLAKSARKILAKNIGNLELGYYIKFHFVENEKRNRLTSIDEMKPIKINPKDLNEVKNMLEICVLLNKFLAERVININDYRLVEEVFSSGKFTDLLVLYFKIKLIMMSGFPLDARTNKLIYFLSSHDFLTIKRLKFNSKIFIESRELINQTISNIIE